MGVRSSRPSRRPGMQHANAPLTPNGRLRMVLLVVEDGFTSNVAKSTVHTRVGRWWAARPEEGRSLGCLEDRPSRPRTSPGQVPVRRPRGSASGASGRGGARAGSLTSSTSPGRTQLSTRCCAAEGAHAVPSPNGRRWSATSGRARETCCTWTSKSSAASSRAGTPSRWAATAGCSSARCSERSSPASTTGQSRQRGSLRLARLR